MKLSRWAARRWRTGGSAAPRAPAITVRGRRYSGDSRASRGRPRGGAGAGLGLALVNPSRREKWTLSDPGRLGRQTRCPVSVGAGSLTARAGVAQGTQPSPGVSPRAACVSLQATVKMGLDASRSLAPQGPAYGVRRPSGVSGLGAGTEALWGQELRRVLRRPQALPEILSAGRAGTVGWRSAACSSGQSRLIPIVATQSISSLRAVLGQSEAWRGAAPDAADGIFLSLADDSSAQIASTLCGQEACMKGVLHGLRADRTGRRVAPVRVRRRRRHGQRRREQGVHRASRAAVASAQLRSARQLRARPSSMPHDGSRSLDARRCYLKPDFLPRDGPYWRRPRGGGI